MALNKIKTGSITDDAVNSDKLAAGSVTNTELNKTAITGQAELSETANDADFTIIYDTSSASLKKILRSNLKQAAPVFTSVSPTNVDTTTGGATSTLVITGTGFTAGSNARLIDNSGKIVDFTTVTRNSATQITAVVTNSNLDTAQSPYDIQITNGEGIAIVSANQLDVNASPIWITSSGSLGSGEEGASVNFTVQAYDPDSTSVVSYEIQSGALPGGLSLTSSSGDIGTISGTLSAVSADTTFNFVVRATDSASNTASRAFAITVTNKIFQTFTTSGTFSVPTGVSAVDVLVVAGGGAGGYDGSGGGAGGLIFVPSYPVTPGGTVSVTVGCGAAAPDGSYLPGGSSGIPGITGSHPSPTMDRGQNSAFGTLTAVGGGTGGGRIGPLGNPGVGKGRPGGSGGGISNDGYFPGPGQGWAGGNGPSFTGSGIQSTQPDDSGAYGFGNPGGVTSSPFGQGSTGGGGAGGAGQPETSGTKASGGIGKAYTIADGTTPVYYAGGGGGGHPSGFSVCQGAGSQGGGASGGEPGGAAGPAQANKGGGGGGGGPSGSPAQGSAGGKGIVIVRWS